MVNAVTSSDLHYDKGEERVDMCEVIEGIRKDAILETLVGVGKRRTAVNSRSC